MRFHGQGPGAARGTPAGTPAVRRGVLVALLSGALLAPAAAVAPAAADVRFVDVVVTGVDASSAGAAVQAAGGSVTSELPLVDGVAARLPEGASLPSGFRVTADRPVSFASAGLPADAPASTVRETLGLRPDGSEGKGVTVAVVDTGVADVADLRGRVVGRVDVTETGGGDGYGHGTFLAGMIAGSGEGSGGAYRGVAPGANIFDVKVAGPDGSTSLAVVLEGLQVVADRGRALGVRVVNLSLSSGSPVPYQVDPLNQALRALWHRGVTVVVSSGNDGPGAGSVSTPGNDPLLLTVGGVDEGGTAERADDTVAAFSGRGPTNQGISKPEIVAPGAAVIGLRSPGSVIDTNYPQARVGEQYFRGSGTSMSAAVASAVAAGVLAENPQLRPDDVKSLLVGTAYDSPGLADSEAAGEGGLDAAAALALADSVVSKGKAPAADRPGAPAAWAALADAFEAEDRAAAVRAWDALGPQARSWAARSWAALDPSARSWAARSWAAGSWAGADGTAEEWAARSWAARSWAARSWAARSWAGDDWAARSWAARSWAARSWAGDDWAARSWAARSWAARSWAGHWG
jgi:serine protease AprX